MIDFNKKGKLSSKLVQTVVLAIVVLVIILKAYAVILPEAQTAGDDMNKTNRCNLAGCVWNLSENICTNGTSATGCTLTAQSIPLGGLFGSSGMVFVIIMAMLMIVLVKSYMGGKK